jgi:hypothetical protein
MVPQLQAIPANSQIFVNPTGNDESPGTREAPFRTLARAQQEARKAAETATSDVTVNLGTGVYRLDRTLTFGEPDSGRDGHRVVYRSADGLGKARLLGSVLLAGWREYRDGIWQIPMPEGAPLPHTLYENGKRAHKARYPNHVFQPDFPTARGPYFVTEDGCKEFKKGEGEAWLTYAPEDAPPVTDVSTMRIAIYLRGKCDWMRTIYAVRSVDPAARRIVLDRDQLHFGILARARYFLEDELGFLDAPGEFYADGRTRTLYYKPMGKGHPDTLGIALPLVDRLIEVKGSSRDECVRNLTLEGLALEETNGNPSGWWGKRNGATDGALIWLRNTTGIEIRNCHLKNSGRHGVMIVGHNTDNRVSGCWIEHMGLNGVTLCNRFTEPGNKPTKDRCTRNVVENCLMHNIGEIHTYAACVNVFNVEDNEIAHCELHDSVRYAITVRGNTGPQYGPPVWTNQPPCKGNRMHHIRAYRCGQDGGDMGTLHCADLNNPNGGCVNTFEQITVADSRAVPSMHDIGPDGIFLDWPRMSMDQIFRNVEIIRSQGTQLRSNRPENGDSAQTVNVSWKPGFDPKGMDYENIGLTDDFPAAYGGRRAPSIPPPAPTGLGAQAPDHRTVVLAWRSPAHEFQQKPQYTLFRDGQPIARTKQTSFADIGRKELTNYVYQVAAQDGDFCHLGPRTAGLRVHTPADRTAPVVNAAWSIQGTKRVRIRFSKPMLAESILPAKNYNFSPAGVVQSTKLVSPDCVELVLDADLPADGTTATILRASDATASHNPLVADRIPVTAGGRGAAYHMQLTADGRLLDSLGGAGDAQLFGDAKVVPDAGPDHGPALVLDGDGDYAQASGHFQLDPAEFTIMAWLWRETDGTIVLSQGNGFDDPSGWSFGWAGQGKSKSVSLRNLNVFRSTAANSVPLRTWVQVAFVRRGDRAFTYANGKPSGGEHDLTGVGDLASDQPLRIGRRAHEPNPVCFKGKLAHIEILPRALSAAEIQSRFAAVSGQ